MDVKKIVSYLGGYFNSTDFEFDISKVADIAEVSENEVMEELDNLQSAGDIKIEGNTITLINIKPDISKKFNNLYAPVETVEWKKGTKLKLD